MAIDKRKPSETGKTGKIVFPDTRLRKIVVEPDEYAPPSSNAGIRVKPQGIIHRFDPSEGIKLVVESSEMSIHGELTPNNPTEITATAISSSMVEIAATVDPGGNDGVEIHHSTTQGGPYSLETTVEETDFPVQISGLASETTHYFVLRAFLFDGVQVNASFTDEVSATTGAGGSAPSSPSQPQISEISRTATTMTLEATWTDVADETEYQWTAGSNDGTTWSDGGTIAADSTSVQFVATRTNLYHTGFFCVKACNASGCSVNSCNGFTVAGNLTAPSNLAATNPSGSDVDLDWTDMSGATVADETAIERRLVGGSFAEIDTVAFGVTHYDDNSLADGDYEYQIRHRDTGTGDTSPYSGSDSVTIGGGGGGGGGLVIFDEGWSSIQPAGWIKSSNDSNLSIVSVSGEPEVLQIRYPDGMTGGSPGWVNYNWKSNDGITSDDLTIKMRWACNSGWQGHDSFVNKIWFLNLDDSEQSHFVLVFYATNQLRIAPQKSGGWSWLSQNVSSTQPSKGSFNDIELRFTKTAPSTWRVRIWLNDELISDHSDVPMASGDGSLASLKMDGTWGGVGDEKTQDDFFWHDRTTVIAEDL